MKWHILDRNWKILHTVSDLRAVLTVWPIVVGAHYAVGVDANGRPFEVYAPKGV